MSNSYPRVTARAPLRLGLGGGGTDVSPYCDEHGGLVINATIDRYAYAVLKPREDDRVRLHAADLGEEVEISGRQLVEPIDRLKLVHTTYNFLIEKFHDGQPIPMDFTTFCDAPKGSGLGASSTLVTAMVKGFVELLNLPLDEYGIAALAYEIERIKCGFAGGRQDQYSAAFGGVNFIEFYAEERVLVNPLRVKGWVLCELEASLLLYFTGESRESASIIANQVENLADKRSLSLDALHRLKREATIMKESLLRADFAAFAASIQDGWEYKKKSAESVSNGKIDAVHEAAINAGALAGKVSGAGGGGFMWFFMPPEKRMAVSAVLASFGGSVSNCHFTRDGCQAWRL